MPLSDRLLTELVYLYCCEADAIEHHRPMRLHHGGRIIHAGYPHNATSPADAEYVRGHATALRLRILTPMSYDAAMDEVLAPYSHLDR
jgi:hypothetical protein